MNDLKQLQIAFGLNALALTVSVAAAIRDPNLTNVAASLSLAAALYLQHHIWLPKPFHPPDERHRRSEIQQCRFNIDPGWETAPGWKGDNSYSDVLIDVLDVPMISGIDEKVYLIPSGYAPKALEDTKHLKTEKNKRLRRAATEEFIRRYKHKTLSGYYFTMALPGRGLKAKAYCVEFDNILRRHRNRAD
jgi:hypothetical protein